VQFAHVNSIVLHYRTEGPEDAPALVFSNSLGTDFRVWDEAIPLIEEPFRIVRYDKRGHGLSQATPAPYTLADHGQDLAALLQHLRVTSAVVCGLSAGGLIAQSLAIEYKSLVRGLILSGTAYRIGTAQSWNSRIEVVESKGMDAIADGVMERWFSGDFCNQRPHDVAGWRNMLTRTPVEGYVGTCAALRDADLTRAVDSIKVPTLCICGSEDGATPPDLVRSLSRQIDGAHFRLIEGAGHLPCVEKPREFADAVTIFLREAELV
jgi:3-oxoadipate enol-lactonase